LLALVDSSSFWIAAYFKETQLPSIKPDRAVKITLMGYHDQPFEGKVESVAWGIFVQGGSGGTSTGLLAAVNQTVDWVRLPKGSRSASELLENLRFPSESARLSPSRYLAQLRRYRRASPSNPDLEQQSTVSLWRKRRVPPSTSSVAAEQADRGKTAKPLPGQDRMLPLSKQTKWTWARISD
jgi:hypothetical protein